MSGLTIARTVVPFAVGLLTSILLQWAGGWWLNSGEGVVTTIVVLFGVAVAVCLRSDAPWHRAAALSIGSVTGMAAALFWVGPGTIWPIVMAVAAVLTAASVFAGAVVARAIAGRR
jgi:hypothetical protein